MRCLTCDAELADADACPSCGSRRMELPVFTDVGSVTPARPRHRVRNVFVFLLVAGVCVALAGQASHILGGSASSNAPPIHKAKPLAGKTASHPSGDPTSVQPDPVPEATQSLRLYLEPSDADLSGAAQQAIRSAMQQWSDRGFTLTEAANPSDADRTVQLVHDWQGARSRSGPISVGLGDDHCDGTWQAFRAESVQRLAAYGIGRALGEPDSDQPGDAMDSTYVPLHDGPCQMTHGQGTVQTGTPAGKAFSLAATQTTSYSMQETAGRLVDVCFVASADWSAFASGSSVGTACQAGVSSAQGGAALPAGDYMLGFRCQDGAGACTVQFTIAVMEAS